MSETDNTSAMNSSALISSAAINSTNIALNGQASEQRSSIQLSPSSSSRVRTATKFHRSTTTEAATTVVTTAAESLSADPSIETAVTTSNLVVQTPTSTSAAPVGTTLAAILEPPPSTVATAIEVASANANNTNPTDDPPPKDFFDATGTSGSRTATIIGAASVIGLIALICIFFCARGIRRRKRMWDQMARNEQALDRHVQEKVSSRLGPGLFRSDTRTNRESDDLCLHTFRDESRQSVATTSSATFAREQDRSSMDTLGAYYTKGDRRVSSSKPLEENEWNRGPVGEAQGIPGRFFTPPPPPPSTPPSAVRPVSKISVAASGWSVGVGSRGSLPYPSPFAAMSSSPTLSTETAHRRPTSARTPIKEGEYTEVD